jgi:hypothetical protein
MKYSKQAINGARDHLVSAYGISKKHKSAAVVTSVARSGMSRWIKLYILTDNDINNITYQAALLLGEPYDDNKGMKVSGVGMDMVFHSLYRVNTELLRYDIKDPKEFHDKAYNKRGAYDYFIDTNYRRI